MQNQVIAVIEVEDQRIDYYSSVVIKQRFNAHHEFEIRVRHDVLGQSGAFKLKSTQQLIGKSVVIKLAQAHNATVSYEFRGLVCELSMEQSANFTSDLVLRGYSPTILLDNGPHFKSFNKKSLKDIASQVTGDAGVSCEVAPQHKAPLVYISQYRESSFHFLNRLSADYGEWFYYDGTKLYFGKPSGSPEIDITYGHDVRDMQFKLRILPLNFSGFSHKSKEDKVLTAHSPDQVDGLDEYAAFALKESKKVFSSTVSFPVKPRVEDNSELAEVLKKKKSAMAARLEVVSGKSENPAIAIGSVANVKFSQYESDSFSKGDYGKFLITAVVHYVGENSNYYNSFEGIPAGIGAVPVDELDTPIAEPQVATVMDNADPDNAGRVRVQMLWQEADGQQTDWIRVMTPDAGGGKGGAKNRGLVTVPEKGDHVLVAFRYNDPDRPFVMGSLFHGKTGGGGGAGNKVKSLTHVSGSVVTLDGNTISVIDAGGNKVFLDGAGKINVNCSAEITLECGSSKIFMDAGGNIKITGKDINIHGSTVAEMKSTASMKVEGTNASVKGTATEITGEAKVDVGSPATSITGESTLSMKSTGTVNVEGTAMTNVKGGTVNLN
ncbi:type VI secretion system Vgr family protein [Paraflavitalea pollutisoli]|uniref:type VI secretion system Vgr family protein n=1 Tax=Paraflavitalea pollutisoli TaxID=3034143 RepID=UPI0023ED6B6D|nr:phage baseplate assembly protein V [Paraflavitalea sp. H1-2-19X]